jgi:hypothetical protein
MRGHDGSTVMVFDGRYMPLLQWANLLAVTNIIGRGRPVFNVMAITAMVDRLRLETHSFHLPRGEMTVTLDNMVMILRLPIIGRPVTNRCDSASWRDRVTTFLGREPSGKVPDVKG